MKIGVTGATGHLGRLVVSELKEKVPSNTVVALVRSPQKAAELDLGVEVREADYDRPETLDKALEGIEHLLLISAQEVGKRIAQHQHVIDAAKKAGVKWIVYTSMLRTDNSTLSLAGEHQATEDALKKSGIPYTVLRNGWYTENYTNSIPGALANGAFIGSAGEAKISSAARRDYAEAAVAVLTSDNQQGKVYELAGDEAYSLSELAAEISRQTGKQILYKNLPETEYASILRTVGVPDPWAGAIASWDVSASKGDLYEEGRQLSTLIGHPTTPMRETVENALENREDL